MNAEQITTNCYPACTCNNQDEEFANTTITITESWLCNTKTATLTSLAGSTAADTNHVLLTPEEWDTLTEIFNAIWNRAEEEASI